ncbi:hypothetical protein Emtol_0319 (plasmid) [Emticicia oligotrophica DSM 17448]|uniref:DUF4134 domain-containing protein n=1 Tax=Emticicia oligotrophica (strain DSM 17448 / CIP 109782 / MTCC 6937 / GPTSA100-15) TaxID=929562 RepID=A0ABM5N7Z6_EMTOG|nr:DUF4134 family protein [Emticicia oligotrophica]AFK05586.1 hypothetical protein Emtol_0319 [Emticicia oligotrophica DSM 17448]
MNLFLQGIVSPYLKEYTDIGLAKSIVQMVMALSAIMGLYFAYRVFQKFQNGEDDASQKLWLWLTGFLILLVGLVFLSQTLLKNDNALQ